VPNYLYFIILTTLLSSCAEQRPLSGGPKDSTPPRLDSARYSTPNLQTNFREKEIILSFNEWIVLNDPTNQILISPPLQNRPEVKIKHKSVVLKFKEELVPNTTYSIQFGEAVKDFTENNPAQNLRFVFSTGPVLDSLAISGQIVDAISAEPAEKIWVMLYDKNDDSLPYNERPVYVAKTDAQGVFKLENLRSGNFKVFALADNNSNYKYDRGEQIAFLNDPIFLSDSTEGILKLRLFKEDEPLSILSSKLIGKNKYRIQFNRQISDSISVDISENGKNVETFKEFGRDTLLVWWKTTNATNLILTVNALNFIDTFDISEGESGNWPDKALVYSVPETGTTQKTKGKPEEKKFNLHPSNPSVVDYSRPIKEIDFSKVILKDSLSNAETITERKSNQFRSFQFQTKEQLKSQQAELCVLPGAILDIWGETNSDTLKRKYSVLKNKDLGNLKVSISNADSTMNYIVKLLDDKESALYEFKFSAQSTWVKEFKQLEPNRYSIEIIHDKDADGKFTVGNYLKKIQPETVTKSKPTNLRADWDNELEVDLTPQKNTKKK
jgi:uncharacterized protein (DUF2141 family)